MPDLALLHRFVVAYQPREDWQARGVGGRPAGRPQVGVEIEHCARACVPVRAASARIRGEQLVQHPVVDVDDEDVTVAAALRSALDRCVCRNRVGSWIALVIVFERHGHARLRAAHDYVRYPVRRTVPRGAEVRMQIPNAAARDQRVRVWIDGRIRNYGVPRVVCGEGTPAFERCAGARVRVRVRWRSRARRIAGRESHEQEAAVKSRHIRRRCSIRSRGAAGCPNRRSVTGL